MDLTDLHPHPPFAGNTARNKTESLAVCGSAAKPYAPSTVVLNIVTAKYLSKPVGRSGPAFNDFLYSQVAGAQ